METSAELHRLSAENIAAANDLLDEVIAFLHLKNDAALSRTLQVAPPVISKTRHGRLIIGDSLLIRLHEITGWTIAEIKHRLGKPALKLQVQVAQAA